MASAIAVLSIVPTIAEAKTNMLAFKGLNLERSNTDAKSISKTSPSSPTKIAFKTLGLKLQTETFGEMDPAKKHGMSHRADAFRKLVAGSFQSLKA